MERFRQRRVGAAFSDVGIALLDVSFAFGLTVLTMARPIGHISGCHFNSAFSIGLWAGGRFHAGKLAYYIIAQCIGAIVAGLYLIENGKADFNVVSGLASNGYGDYSPVEYSLTSALMTEVVMTKIFLLNVLGSTEPRAPHGLAPIAIGLGVNLDLHYQNTDTGDEHLGQSCA